MKVPTTAGAKEPINSYSHLSGARVESSSSQSRDKETLCHGIELREIQQDLKLRQQR